MVDRDHSPQRSTADVVALFPHRDNRVYTCQLPVTVQLNAWLLNYCKINVMWGCNVLLEGKQGELRTQGDDKYVFFLCPFIYRQKQRDSHNTYTMQIRQTTAIMRGLPPGQLLHTVAHYVPNKQTIPSDANQSGHHYWLPHSIKAVSLGLQYIYSSATDKSPNHLWHNEQASVSYPNPSHAWSTMKWDRMLLRTWKRPVQSMSGWFWGDESKTIKRLKY